MSEERKELKPSPRVCPFCDSYAMYDGDEDEAKEALCPNTDCHIGQIFMPIDAWNSRPAEERLEARVEELETAIRECGMKMYYEKVRAALEGR